MKQRLLILVLISFFSCKKESGTVSPIPVDTIVKTEISKKEVKAVQVDTLKLENLATLKTVDKILITTLRKEINKDSVVKAHISFDFYFHNNLIKSFPSTIVYGAEQGEWFANENVFSTKSSDSRFIELTYGYPACGYTQTNFLFFVGSNAIQFVTTNESMADGGYGTGTLFEPHFKEKAFAYFTAKTVNVDSDESKTFNDENEDLVICYSDSIVYSWETNKWVGALKSQKGKIFRKEFKKFNDYHKLD